MLILDYNTNCHTSSWRRIKKDFLYHFARPRVDLLVWVLVDKLAPLYANRVHKLHAGTGRTRDAPTWRHEFKKIWKTLESRETAAPDSFAYRKYNPDPIKWVCACPAFRTSRFLICKHLILTCHPVPVRFFFEVSRNRTTPFWSHPFLRPLDQPPPDNTALDFSHPRSNPQPHPLELRTAASTEVGNVDHSSDPNRDSETENGDSETEELVSGDEDGDGDGEGELPSELEARYEKDMRKWSSTLRRFADLVDYQVQFSEARFLKEMDRQMARARGFIDDCLEHERLTNSSQRETPGTWSQPPRTLFMHPRPPRAERNRSEHNLK